MGVVNLMPRLNSPRYPLQWRLGGPQRRSGCCGENKHLLAARAILIVSFLAFQPISQHRIRSLYRFYTFEKELTATERHPVKKRSKQVSHRPRVYHAGHAVATMLEAGRSRVRIHDGFFNSSNPSSRTMTLGPTKILSEKSTRNLPWGKGRPARKADLTAICEPTV
jgi:hypothetical protein